MSVEMFKTLMRTVKPQVQEGQSTPGRSGPSVSHSDGRWPDKGVAKEAEGKKSCSENTEEKTKLNTSAETV